MRSFRSIIFFLVFIDLPLETLEQRVLDMDSRGLVIDPGETFSDLFHQRLPLYQRFADLTVDGRDCSAETIAGRIEQLVCGRQSQ